MVTEGSLSKFIRSEPPRRYYKISWVRWPVRKSRWSPWHFQPRIPDQSLACDELPPAEEAEVELARGLLPSLGAPEGRRCRTCDRAARLMFS